MDKPYDYEQIRQQKSHDRLIYMFDTYEGMTEPDVVDVDLIGRPATQLLSSPVEIDYSGRLIVKR